jgi:ABC-type amino acid transport substrate-binding protein
MAGANGAGVMRLRILTLESAPYVVKSSNGQLTGFIPDLLALVAPHAGVKYDLSLQADGAYGVPGPNGSYNGAVGQLIAGTYDVVAADLTVTADRDKVIDFTPSFLGSSLRLAYSVQSGLDNVNYLVLQNSAQAALLKTTKVPKYQAIWKNIQANNGLVETTDAGIQKVLAGGFAMVVEVPGVNTILAANPGKLMLDKDSLLSQFYAFGVKKGSSLRDKFGIALLKAAETGAVQALINQYGLSG